MLIREAKKKLLLHIPAGVEKKCMRDRSDACLIAYSGELQYPGTKWDVSDGVALITERGRTTRYVLGSGKQRGTPKQLLLDFQNHVPIPEQDIYLLPPRKSQTLAYARAKYHERKNKPGKNSHANKPKPGSNGRRHNLNPTLRHKLSTEARRQSTFQ